MIQAHSPFAAAEGQLVSTDEMTGTAAGAEAGAGAVSMAELSHGLISTGEPASGNTVSPPTG